MRRLVAALRRRFLAGLLVTVPIVATLLVLRFLLQALDGLLGPIVTRGLGREIPGLGAILTLLVVLGAGLVATNVLGRRLVGWLERGVARVPVVSGIYRATREIVSTATLGQRQVFRDVVLVEHPRRGTWAYGFVTSYTALEDGERLANVFLPGPPVPTSGQLIVAPVADLRFLDMSVEEALKLILSGGLVAPPRLPTRASPEEAKPA
jgi:uncharacterized membrane protein